MAACGSDDRTDGQGPPCDCPEFIELIDTIDWSAGHGTTNQAAIYMAEPYQAYGELEPGRAHAIFGVRTTPVDPEVVAADLVQALTNAGLAVAEQVRSDGTVAYDVTVDGGELNIWPVARPEGGGGINFHLRSVPNPDALQPYVAALGLIEPTSD